MTLSDILIIIAIILGPILAVQVQKFIEWMNEKRTKKLAIFKTLMATRENQLSYVHVEALNKIDIEFTAKKDKSVTDSWKMYHDHLGDMPRDHEDDSYKANFDAWLKKANDCLVNLLYVMAQNLGYDFDKVLLKKGAYTPQGYADMDVDLFAIRRGVAELLHGKRSLPIQVVQGSGLQDAKEKKCNV